MGRLWLSSAASGAETLVAVVAPVLCCASETGDDAAAAAAADAAAAAAADAVVDALLLKLPLFVDGEPTDLSVSRVRENFAAPDCSSSLLYSSDKQTTKH
jgi:hypothetical protein